MLTIILRHKWMSLTLGLEAFKGFGPQIPDMLAVSATTVLPVLAPNHHVSFNDYRIPALPCSQILT